jgi:steroid delta-isomerase-like uncharacterized protein
MNKLIAAVCLLAVVGCSSVHTNAKLAEDNKAMTQRFIDRMNKHDLSAIDEFFDASFVEHDVPPGMPPNREGMKQMFQMFLKGFPDMKMTVDHVVAEGDLVMIHLTTTGTNKGEMMGLPATNKVIKVQEMHLARVVNGKFVEHWGVEDQMTMLQQLGIMPDPGKK